MKTLLLRIKAEVDKAQQCGRKRLPPCRRKEFLRKYDEAIEQAKNLYGALKRKRGRVKKQGRGVMETIKSVLAGNILMPQIS